MSARVLLVEDDHFLRKAGAAMLRKHGFEVVTACDGEEGLHAARTMSPDLVLLDLVMPKLHGFEVLQRLKADAATAAIPVVILSNLGQEADLRRAMAAGAVEYFIKANTSLSVLIDQIRHVLKSNAA